MDIPEQIASLISEDPDDVKKSLSESVSVSQLFTKAERLAGPGGDVLQAVKALGQRLGLDPLLVKQALQYASEAVAAMGHAPEQPDVDPDTLSDRGY